ncbi:MarR family winged helix-turn-helix transcriptional regulator [Microbacterium sp. 1P10UB]|uniref:MarR family winged helix-turn-helix transcriptional regulator n=1 Tax=unclassified Microbacterium TaxID=2609290 RepID=UPI00399FDCE6
MNEQLPPRATSLATDELYYTLNRLSRSMNRAADDISWRHGVSLAEFNVLLVLAEGVLLSSAQLARRAFVTPQSSHQVVSTLVAGGLVETVEHPTDGRIKLARLTDAGWEVLDAARGELRVMQARAMSDLSEADRERVPAILATLAETLQGGWFGDVEAAEAAAARRPLRGTLARTPDIRPLPHADRKKPS